MIWLDYAQHVVMGVPLGLTTAAFRWKGECNPRPYRAH